MPNIVTANQKRAIETVQGPVLITAGPGTGKTFTIVERILYLIKNKLASPNEILVVTFTDKATKELLTRVSNRFKEEGLNKINIGEMYISTFHSLCIRLISENAKKCHGLSKNYVFLEEYEQVGLISRNIKEVQRKSKNGNFSDSDVESFCDIDGSRDVIESYLLDTDYTYKKGYAIKKWQAAKKVCSLCDTLIEELIDPKELIKNKDPKIAAAGKMLKQYEALLAENNYAVFSVLLQSVYRMLSDEAPDGELRNKFKYIMVDEYQDTNYIQEKLIELLGGTEKNICVVGDDDQSLYRFRGATVENILTFADRYASYGCKTIHLDENFRSNDKIVSFYNRWIQNPQDFEWGHCRLKKELFTKKTAETETVVRITGNDAEQWKKNIYSFIEKLKRSNKISDYNQIVFLCKSVKNEKITDLQKYLTDNGIPVYSPRSQMFFERDEIKLAIGCLLHMFPKAKEEAKKKNYVEYCSDAFKKAQQIISKDRGLKSVIESIANDANCPITVREALYRLFEFQPFASYVDVDLDADLETVRPSRNLSILISKCSMFEKTYKKGNAHNNARYFFGSFLYHQFEDGVDEYEDEKEYAPKNHVSFMTFHQSKGLEFPIVVVDSLNRFAKKESELSLIDMIINTQHPNSFEPKENIEFFDFWREYYTAFSRAQNLLVLTCPNEPNRIFDEMWNDIPEASESVPDLSKLSFDTVKSAELSDSYAFTADILPYEKCPKRYKFTHMLGYKLTREESTLIGSLVHDTLQDLHLEAIRNGTVSEDEDEIHRKIDQWLRKNAKREKDIETARKHVLNYYNYLTKGKYRCKEKNRWSTIKDAEMKVSVSMGDFIINGKIDMVREYPTRYKIFDFKTGEKPEKGDKKGEKKLEEYYRQLRIYAHLLGSVAEEKKVSMQLFFTGEEKNPIETLECDEQKDNIKREIKTFTETVKKIMNHEFSSKSMDPSYCRKCDFRFLCKKSAGN